MGRVVEDREAKKAGNRRLLGDFEAADLAHQGLQQIARLARALDEIAQVVASALHAVMLDEYRISETGGDAVFLERRIVFQINRLGGAALHLIERRLRDIEKAFLDQLRHLAE